MPQFYRIRMINYVGCWIANGRIICSGLVGCVDRSATFHRAVLNQQHIPKQEIVCPKRNPTPNKRETEMLIICRMRTTLPTPSSQGESQLYIFEDDEVVIKMIIKGRSPTMRHVSRTHRVALDWLVDRINLDPKIQIKYIDTKNQLADLLTKGNFTRDEWNHLWCFVQHQPFQFHQLS